MLAKNLFLLYKQLRWTNLSESLKQKQQHFPAKSIRFRLCAFTIVTKRGASLSPVAKPSIFLPSSSLLLSREPLLSGIYARDQALQRLIVCCSSSYYLARRNTCLSHAVLPDQLWRCACCSTCYYPLISSCSPWLLSDNRNPTMTLLSIPEINK